MVVGVKLAEAHGTWIEEIEILFERLLIVIVVGRTRKRGGRADNRPDHEHK